MEKQSDSYGSSPRMRGTHEHGVSIIVEERFIPAHAGNSGEKRMAPTPENGSSPRMRGTLEAGVGRVAQRRFIPAHAGNSPG